MSSDELRVLAVLALAALFAGAVCCERRVSGPNTVTTAVLVLCAAVILFCTLLLGVLYAERRVRRKDRKEERAQWHAIEKRTWTTTGRRSSRT